MTLPFLVWPLLALTMITALLAGVFLTFSDFLMRALYRSAPASGTEAMQTLNREVYRSLFMVLFLGMVPVSVAVVASGTLWIAGPGADWLRAAGLLYLIGVFGVTAAGNVPMNQRLDGMALAGESAQAYWPAYVRGWLRWNHVRGLAALAAAICYMIAALALATGA